MSFWGEGGGEEVGAKAVKMIKRRQDACSVIGTTRKQRVVVPFGEDKVDSKLSKMPRWWMIEWTEGMG